MRRSINELQFGGFAVVMKLKCELEVVYSLAVASGGVGNRSHRARASLSLGKKLGSNASGGRSWEEIFLIVSTAKNVSGTKYKVDYHLLPIASFPGSFLYPGSFPLSSRASVRGNEPGYEAMLPSLGTGPLESGSGR